MENTPLRAGIFIDGSNLYHGLRRHEEALGLKRKSLIIRFPELRNAITREFEQRLGCQIQLVHASYFNFEIRGVGEFAREQDLFYRQLKSQGYTVVLQHKRADDKLVKLPVVESVMEFMEDNDMAILVAPTRSYSRICPMFHSHIGVVHFGSDTWKWIQPELPLLTYPIELERIPGLVEEKSPFLRAAG